MEIEHIEARDLPDAWYRCLFRILDDENMKTGKTKKYSIDRGSYEGQQRLEFDFIVVRIKYPGSLPLIPDTPEGIPAPVDMKYVEEYLSRYIMSDVKAEGEEYTYGERLVNPKFKDVNNIEVTLGVNQIDEVIRMYKKDGFGTNQATMEVGMPSDVLSSDPPCLRLIDTRIEKYKASGDTEEKNRLDFFVYFRSWDLWGGFPANLAGLEVLKQYMASEIGVDSGEIVAASKGLHLYDHCWDLAKKVLRR